MRCFVNRTNVSLILRFLKFKERKPLFTYRGFRIKNKEAFMVVKKTKELNETIKNAVGQRNLQNSIHSNAQTDHAQLNHCLFMSAA